MSLNATDISVAAAAATKCPVTLRTADQYDMWKSRVADSCWAVARKDVFKVTDDECKAALATLDEVEAKNGNIAPFLWVGKCWAIITTSLHDDLYRKLNSVPRGLVAMLLKEIAHALSRNTIDEVAPLRLELYGATMQKNCGNDLQTWINFMVERGEKLRFLGKPVEEPEMIALFVKGLNPVFNQLQVYFAIPGQLPKTFEGIVSIVRKFAANPYVAADLAKLKSPGLSQSMFPVQIQQTSNQGGGAPQDKSSTIRCNTFARTGSCRFGTKCKFLHVATPASAVPPTQPQTFGNRKCTFCSRFGHTEERCNIKQKLLDQLQQQQLQQRQAATLAASSESQEDLKLQPQPELSAPPQDAKPEQEFPFAQYNFVFATDTNAPTTPPNPKWVLDSGATCCATFSEDDCLNVRDCNINVTAAGATFSVQRVGTAVISARDELGRTIQLNMQNTLISNRFPFKLLALQVLTSKGNQVVIDEFKMRIVNRLSDVVLLGTKDPTTNLFFLDEAKTATTLLARSYGGGNDLLWTLHLRHGHRNFTDVARQYGLTLPKELPACTSCIMAKSHVHPHLASADGFERATRVAEGFHSDFRGPFTVPTPTGELYLLTIIDDYTRRIFAFLVKSQSEWFDIFTKFVLRIEAEIGRANCISWLLSDNGSVYCSGQMQTFCAGKGIQQRFSAPYAQWMDHTAERNMRTIGEMGLTTLVHANLPRSSWGYAMLHAVEVINRTADSADINKKAKFPTTYSRLEKWKNKPLPGQTKGLYPFGCLAFKHIPSAIRKKLDDHALPNVYLGFDPKCRAYLLGSLYQLDLTTAVEVTFVENVFPFRKLKHREAPASLLWGTDNNLDEGDARLGMFAQPDSSGENKILDRQTLKSIGAYPNFYEEEETKIAPSTLPAAPSPPTPLPLIEDAPTRRSSRVARSQDDWQDYYPEQNHSMNLVTLLLAYTETQLQTITPRSANQALRSKSSLQWLAAMNREKQCHVKNGTFGKEWSGAGPCPKPIPAGWVFKIKHRGDPIEEQNLQPKQFKARVVVRGQFMKEGLDFNDTLLCAMSKNILPLSPAMMT